MKLLSAIILENEGFSLNDLNTIQQMALKRAYLGKIDFENISEKEREILDSLVNLGLVDEVYDVTPEGEKAAGLIDKYIRNQKDEVKIARQLAAAEVNRETYDEDDEYYDDEDDFFTEGEKIAMKAAGLNPKMISKLFKNNDKIKEFKTIVENFPDTYGKKFDDILNSSDDDALLDYHGRLEHDGVGLLGKELTNALIGKLEEIMDERGIQFDEFQDDDEHDQFMNDAEADADALASAGWGSDEDYGHYGGDEGW